MDEIRYFDFARLDSVQAGNAQDDAAATGVTVFFFPKPAMASAVVLGGGPASRELPLLDPERNTQPLNALVFSGGSAHGLAAADGVMRCLEQAGYGYDMGMRACENAMRGHHPLSGNVGAGTGATVGKAAGMARSQKSGIGYAAARLGELEVGVSVVVNALGDIFAEGRKIAGMTTPDRRAFASAEEEVLRIQASDLITGAKNTTLAAVFTNGDFDTASLKKVAAIASAGMARCIRPVFTMADGDTVYAVSSGSRKVRTDVNTVGILAAIVLEKAIADAVTASRIPDEAFLSQIH